MKKKIKFLHKICAYKRAKIPTEDMLHNRKDAKSIAFASAYFVATSAAWRFQAFSCAPILAYLSFACACITHNTMHKACFRRPALESAWRALLTLAYGHPTSTFVPGHNLSHHKYTQSRQDPMRTSSVRYRWHLLNLLFFQPTVAATVFRLDVAYLRAASRKEQRAAAAQWALLIASRVLLLALDWRRALALVWLPNFCAQWGIVTMNLLQHDGCEVGLRNYHMARNFVGPVTNFLAFNNGFHTVHHFFPTLHWSELPAAHAAKIAPYMDARLNEACMARYVWRTFVWPGRRTMYTGEPWAPSADDDLPLLDWTSAEKVRLGKS